MPPTRKNTAPQEPEESARDRFRRLAEHRTGRGLEAIIALRGLANRDRYEYEEADVDKIVTAIRDELTVTENALREGKVPAAVAFHL